MTYKPARLRTRSSLPSMVSAVVREHAQLFEHRALDNDVFGQQLRIHGVRGQQMSGVHGACQIAMRRLAIVAPIAGAVLDIDWQTPVVHEQTAAGRFEFHDEFGECPRIHDRALLHFELDKIFSARAAPVRCIKAARRRSRHACGVRARSPSPTGRQAHASRHSSSDSGSCPGATKTSPRSMTAMAMLRTSATPSQETACCRETTLARGRNAGELATRMTSPAAPGRTGSGGPTAPHRWRTPPSVARAARTLAAAARWFAAAAAIRSDRYEPLGGKRRENDH